MAATNVSDTDPHVWKYVSEGGASIVFSYAGPANPQFDGKVLRLRKTTLQDGPAAPDADGVDDPVVTFQQRVMERLIPPEHLPRLESVHTDQRWLDALAALRDADRPLERRQHDRIDVRRRKAVLATDLVGGQGLSIEIKPKCAFLPSLVHLSPATRPVKAQTCRFCMHSHLKTAIGQVVSVGYCPLDLFSGDVLRIARAVHSLWHAWADSQGSVNNLRVFSQGRLVKPIDVDLVARQLPQTGAAHLHERFASAVVPLLTQTPVLDILRKLQQTLDALDIEGLSQLWHRNHGSTPLGTGAPNPSLAEWTEFIDAYLSSRDQMDHGCPSSPTDLRHYLLAYLLAATFKDCSIMLRLDHDVSLGGVVTVIDLDPKGMDRLGKWQKLDGEIVESYIRSGAKQKRCIE